VSGVALSGKADLMDDGPILLTIDDPDLEARIEEAASRLGVGGEEAIRIACEAALARLKTDAAE
jgi:hypothetical protein